MGFLSIKLGRDEMVQIGDVQVICTTHNGTPMPARVLINAPKDMKILRVPRPKLKGEKNDRVLAKTSAPARK
jgi:sRNA-binding carbon storage regulator CsrA